MESKTTLNEEMREYFLKNIKATSVKACEEIVSESRESDIKKKEFIYNNCISKVDKVLSSINFN